MTCSAGEALLFTGTSVTVGDYAWDEVRGWKQSGSSVSLVKGWYLRSNTEDCLPIYSTGVHIANYCADASFDSTHKRVAFTLLASAKLYNSSGTVIKRCRRAMKCASQLMMDMLAQQDHISFQFVGTQYLQTIWDTTLQ